MRRITKRFAQITREPEQLELLLAYEGQKNSNRQGRAISFAVAGCVCIVAAIAIHRSLLVIVGPVGAGLLGGAGIAWSRSKREASAGNLPLPVRMNSEHKLVNEYANEEDLQMKFKLPDSW